MRLKWKMAVSGLLVVLPAAGPIAQQSGTLVGGALSDSSFAWRSSEIDAVRIYYLPDSHAERHRMTLIRSVTKTIEETSELFESPPYERTLHVFYVESREEMNRLVGMPATGYADWSGSGIFLVVNPDWRSFEKHEFAHILTMGGWGRPAPDSRWMIEGIAIYADGWCRQYRTDEIAYHFLAAGDLPPLREFTQDHAALGEIRAGFYAGSVIGFIHATYGTEALRDLWTNGGESFTATAGVGLDGVEEQWKSYLKTKVGGGAEVDVEAIDDQGCG